MDVDYSFLQALWFILIAVLWIGFFVLEGFDFGVGMLMRTVAKTPAERRALLHTIGPMWDLFMALAYRVVFSNWSSCYGY